MKIRYIAALTILFLVICLHAKATEPLNTTPSIYKSVDKVKMDRWVDSVYNQLSTEQRIGQLFMPVVPGNNTQSNISAILALLKNQHIGGLLFSKSTPTDQVAITNAAQRAAKVPLMISLDGEWGLSMRLSNTTRFPRNMMLGAIQNDSLLYYYGLEVARQCKLMGIHVNFAPVLDVNSNPDNPVIGNRSFGENPDRVARLGIMYSKGLEAGGVMAVAKHFPGHGDTSTDSHKTLPTVNHDRNRLDNFELYPFKKYIEAGLSGMMVGHLYVPVLDEKKQPSSLSSLIATNLLKNELGFSGLVFTDGLQMKGVSDEENYCVRALLAGNDILLGPVSVVKEYNSVKKAVEDGLISKELLESKCKKVLAYKYILNVNKTPVNTTGLIKRLNMPKADLLNRDLNKESISLLKDDSKIIPLKELGQRKIAAISIGESGSEFHKTLKLYGDIRCFDVANAEGLLKLKTALAKYNTLIISVHSTRVNANAAIQSIMQGKETVLAFFVVPYKMSSYIESVKKADAIVLGYEGSDYAQNYAAQAIFGGVGISGKTPVSIKGLFNEGVGIDTKKNRLEYGLPETVGIESDRLKPIDNIIQEGIKGKAFPGAQLLIAKDGVVIYNKSYGTFEYNGVRKVGNDDIFDIASMTKATATVPAIMKLYDESKIGLNSALSSYVPVLKKTDKAKITVRQALLHETGLSSFLAYYMDAIDRKSYEGRLFRRTRTPLYSAQFDETTYARTDYKFKPKMVSPVAKSGFVPLADKLYINKSYNDTIIADIAKSKLRKNKDYHYSCLNFMLLKEAVESITKKSFDEYVENSFFNRLGATTTMYNPLKKFKKAEIVPTEKDDFLRKQVVQGYVHDEGAAFMGGVSGNAGVFSNANDLAKLYQMMLNNGTYGGERYYSEKTGLLFTRTKSATSRRGLGFDKPEVRTNKSSPCSFSTPASTYGHTGFTGTCFWVDPDNNLIYIFLSNRIYPKRTHKDLMKKGIRERIQEEIYRAMRKNRSVEELAAKNTETDNTNTETNDEEIDIE